VRFWALLLVVAGCSKDGTNPPRREPARGDAQVSQPAPVDAAPPEVKSTTYPDLAAALKATIPATARVVGFGEMHMRTDRKQVKSALARFTQDGLPAIADQLSDLVVETWIVDPKCGQKAQTTTTKVEMTVRRPAETKNEIALLADAARAAKIQPHAMKLTCADYEKVTPSDGQVSPDVMLDLTTAELARISREAVTFRDKKAEKRPWIGVYGGALHNDRMPATGVEQWSYAAKADEASKDRFVEVDLIVPELAEADQASHTQPWYSLVTHADDKVRVWERGERSFVVVLPKSPAATPAP
jgi:hypothetical protein